MSGKWFSGKVALVTGAASGIGRATAIAFAREGAKVVVADIAVLGGEDTVAQIRAAGGEAIFVAADVSVSADVQAMVVRAVEAFGRLDCAFNNAGINDPGFDEWDEAVYDRSVAVNLKGVMMCIKYEVQQMLKQGGGGAIVNTSSVNGLTGSPQAGYVSTKHGVIGLTRSAAKAHALAGIRVNAVCPGAILTPMVERAMSSSPQVRQIIENMHPIGRLGQPHEVAEAVLWLCSDKASFVTGHPLAVDGGFLA